MQDWIQHVVGRRAPHVLTLVAIVLLLVGSLVSVALAAETTTTTTDTTSDTTDTTSDTTDTTSSTSTSSSTSTTATSSTTTTSTTLVSTTTPWGRVDTHIAGPDRYATAVLVSQRAYPDGAPAVVLVKGDDFPDALAAAPLAAAYGGPVLLTPSGGLTPTVEAELTRLDPAVVFFIGLPLGLRASVETLLPAAEVRTLVGTDRYHTATLIADELVSKIGPVTSMVLVPGDRFPDALSVAPLAAAKGWPILLTPQVGPLPSVTSAKIQALGVTSALIAGTYVKPPASITDVVLKVGRDRYYTSALVAEYAATVGSDFRHIALATGENYPDALVVGPYLALDHGLVLLTRPTGFSAPINNLVAANWDSIERVDFVGLPPNSLMDERPVPVVIPPEPVYPTLRWGSTGPAVTTLENKLAALRYDVGRIDGVYDEALKDAVMAFQKVEGLSRTGVAGSDVWRRLETARVPVARYRTGVNHVEIDLTRQVLLLVRGNTVIKVLPVSTGASSSPTPAGSFTIYRKLDYWRQSALGFLYMPSYFYGGIAIHGSNSVPTYPASHGCVRIPVWATPAIYYQMPIGMNVRVYR